MGIRDSLPPPNRGAQIDLHIKLYEEELAYLDTVAREHGCSRSAVFSALIREYLPPILADKRKGRARP